MKQRYTALFAILLLFIIGCYYYYNRESPSAHFDKHIMDAIHQTVPNAFFEQADAYKYAQDYRRALTAFEKLLPLSKTAEDSLYTYNQLAYIALAMNEDSAAAKYIQALEAHFPLVDKSSTPSVLGDYFYNRGVFAYRVFHPKEAESLLKTALGLYEKVYGGEHLKVAMCLTELGMMHYEFNRADTTLKYISTAYDIFQLNDNLKTFSPLCELGMAYVNVVKRSHIEGESRCDNALQILEKLPYNDIILMARCYCMKGYMLKKQGQFEKDSLKKIKYFKEAATNFSKAVELGQKKVTSRLQEFYSELIINYSWQNNTEALFQNIDKLKLLLINQPLRYGYPDRLIGYHYFNNDDIKCKESYLNLLGKISLDSSIDNKILLESYYTLANTYINLEKFDSALFFVKKYYLVDNDIKKNIETDDLFNPNIYNKIIFPAAPFSWIGEILLKKYKKTQDFEDLKLAFKSFILADDLLFPGIMTADEDAIGTYQKEVAEKTYSFGLETTYELYKKTKNPFLHDYIFKFCERSKAFLLYRNTSSQDFLEKNKIPPKLLLDSIKVLGSEINQLICKKNFGELNSSNITKSKERYEKLFQEVKIKYPKYYLLKTLQPVSSVKSIQSTLKEQQGVIQYHWSKNKIHILFISKKSIICHQTNSDSTFGQSIKAYKAVMSGEINLTPLEYSKIAYNIYKKLLDTLAPQLKKLKELIIIPDKELHLIPFEALVTNDIRIDSKINFKKLPYFIHSILTTYSPAWKIYQNNRGKLLNDHPQILAMTYGQNPKVKGNLPKSLQEIDSLAMIMNHSNITRLYNFECSKENFIKYASEFDILHLSLHAESNLTDKYDNKIYFKIPLGDTLYGFDISKINFKAKLVVLSACNTASGKTESSEGAYSLTRSFLQAGVSNVVASLWNISDSQTATLLPYFYHQLAENNTPSVSLHFAKLKYLKEKTDNLTAHPMYWAGLVCVD